MEKLYHLLSEIKFEEFLAGGKNKSLPQSDQGLGEADF